MRLILHTGTIHGVVGVKSSPLIIFQRLETEKEMIDKAFDIYKKALTEDVEIFCNLNIVYDALRLAHVREFGTRPDSTMQFIVRLYEKDKPERVITIDRHGREDTADGPFDESINLVQNMLLAATENNRARNESSSNTKVDSHAS